jgi:hypothetical protein
MLSAVPAFQSNPDSMNKLFLDFDGHTLVDSLDDYWTQENNDNDIHAPVYNMPDDTDYEFDSSNNSWKPLPFSQQ